jgi:hypothetical protein
MSTIRHAGGGAGVAVKDLIAKRRTTGAGVSLAAVWLLAAGCTGAVLGGGTGGPGGGNNPNPGSPGGVQPPPGSTMVIPPGGNEPVAIPPDQPQDAPVTGAFASAPGPSSRFVRLSHLQWENTVNDLFRGTTRTGISRDFLSEPIRSSFNNNGSIVQVGSELWLDYQKAAGELATAARDAKVHGSFLSNGAKDARAFIRNLGLRAYRRPLTDAEVGSYEAHFGKGAQLVGSGDNFADGVELVIEAMLQSPHFIYRAELGSNVVGGKVQLTDYEIAARLSYGLVNSMPDEPLFSAAQGNKLRNRDEVLAQARRLLESERGKETLRDFHSQLLRLDEYVEVKREVAAFPEFKTEMAADMRTEAETFVREVVFGQSKGVAELLTAPYSYVNSRLAPLYGASVPAGQSGFVKVDLNPQQRAGVYTQIGFLAVNATDGGPRSIMRGVHMNLDVLCTDLPAPPAAPPAPPVSMGKTNRQRLTDFTETGDCAACHKILINPLGFAFENFDGLGKFRTQEGNLPIDARAKFTFDEGEKSFDGAVDLIKIVAAGKQAHECYTQHLFEYIYGRERAREDDWQQLAQADTAVIREVGRRSRLKVSIKDMITDLVSTDAFLTRLP